MKEPRAEYSIKKGDHNQWLAKIQVFNGYEIKEDLKIEKYRFCPDEKTWEKVTWVSSKEAAEQWMEGALAWLETLGASVVD